MPSTWVTVPKYSIWNDTFCSLSNLFCLLSTHLCHSFQEIYYAQECFNFCRAICSIIPSNAWNVETVFHASHPKSSLWFIDRLLFLLFTLSRLTFGSFWYATLFFSTGMRWVVSHLLRLFCCAGIGHWQSATQCVWSMNVGKKKINYEKWLPNLILAKKKNIIDSMFLW